LWREKVMYRAVRRMVAVDRQEMMEVRTHTNGKGRSHTLMGMVEEL
jgi:hypothetical protein